MIRKHGLQVTMYNQEQAQAQFDLFRPERGGRARHIAALANLHDLEIFLRGYDAARKEQPIST